MADEAGPTPGSEDEAGVGAAPDAPPARKGPRRMLLIAAAAALLLGGGGGAAWWWFAPGGETAAAETPDSFVDVPPIQVALRGNDGRARMLKLHVMLVPGDKSPEEITPRLPLLLDRYQPFLRELRPDDLSGSAATFRIKEELLIRANQALGEGSVRDVLIQDLMQA